MPHEYSVYKLIDPRTKVVKYVGMTATPQGRIAQHIGNGRLPRSKKDEPCRLRIGKWVNELKAAGCQPEIEVVCVAECRHLIARVEKLCQQVHKDTILNQLIHNRSPMLDEPVFVVVAVLQHVVWSLGLLED